MSDGESSATLGPFTVDVVAVATGSATLTWLPPTENTDGSTLSDLAGYVIYWGTSSGNYSQSVRIENPGVSSYLIDNLLSGSTYYFAVKAFNLEQVESAFSNEASKTIP